MKLKLHTQSEQQFVAVMVDVTFSCFIMHTFSLFWYLVAHATCYLPNYCHGEIWCFYTNRKNKGDYKSSVCPSKKLKKWGPRPGSCHCQISSLLLCVGMRLDETVQAVKICNQIVLWPPNCVGKKQPKTKRAKRNRCRMKLACDRYATAICSHLERWVKSRVWWSVLNKKRRTRKFLFLRNRCPNVMTWNLHCITHDGED